MPDKDGVKRRQITEKPAGGGAKGRSGRPEGSYSADRRACSGTGSVGVPF
jgi:hypothetical protein